MPGFKLQKIGGAVAKHQNSLKWARHTRRMLVLYSAHSATLYEKLSSGAGQERSSRISRCSHMSSGHNASVGNSDATAILQQVCLLLRAIDAAILVFPFIEHRPLRDIVTHTRPGVVCLSQSTEWRSDWSGDRHEIMRWDLAPSTTNRRRQRQCPTA